MRTTYSRSRPPSNSPLLVVSAIFVALVFAGVQMARGLPEVASTSTLPPVIALGEARALPFPPSGAMAVSVQGLGPLGAFNDTGPRPIASVTKVMTAYVVLKGRPLALGERGPTYTVTARDVSTYFTMVAQDQSVVPVSAGMQFSQYEMLQALLVPSANNFAEMLAAWDAGSVQAFVAKMNAEAAALGMRSTTYADASGFSPASRSTAQDQIILIQAALRDPVFADIVAQPQARLPGVGTVFNVNALLGQDGIAGVKTGFTDEAGGCLAFVSRRQVGGQTVDVYGVVLGQPTRAGAFDATRRVVAFAGTTLQSARVVSANQPVATLNPAWGGAIDVVVAEDVSMLLWPGLELQSNVEIGTLQAPLRAGAEVGRLTLRLGDQQREVPLIVSAPLAKPGFFWRLTRL